MQAKVLSAQVLMGAVPPFVASRVRTGLLRATGIRIGKQSTFWDMPTIVAPENAAENLIIGNVCGFNMGCFFDLADRITFEDDVSVGHQVMVLTSGFRPGTRDKRAGEPFTAPVTIGRGAWLGARCTVMPGVTIGAGSVVSAATVVDKDVPPNTLLAGTQKISLNRWRSQ